MSTTAAICRGARGFLVKQLQARLGIYQDGKFGGDTLAAVQAAQEKLGRETSGRADELMFGALGLGWPTELERCLQLTDQFEGTGFGGVNLTDDGAGITLGIVGFTSYNGEIQTLLKNYYVSRPSMVSDFAPARRKSFVDLLVSDSPAAWRRWFYGSDGVVDLDIRETVKKWGDDPNFQALQMDRVRLVYWKRALDDCAVLGLKSMAGHGLMFDCAVQNGGWEEKHQHVWQQETHALDEASRLRDIARIVAECALPKYREDVRGRKLIFATGASPKGFRDGDVYRLEWYGFSQT